MGAIRQMVVRRYVPIMAVLVVLAGLGLPARTVLACSGKPYDPAQADVIAEGWIDRIDIRPEPLPHGPFRTVQMTMRVVQAWKGTAPASIVFSDSSSYIPDRSGGAAGEFVGSTGACGMLDADPTGRYALVVFEQRDGKLATSIFMGAVFGDGPDDPGITRLRAHLDTRLGAVSQARITPASVEPASPELAWWQSAENWPYLLPAIIVALAILADGVRSARKRWLDA
jgi:hypothetical protein